LQGLQAVKVGCFFVSIFNSNKNKIGHAVQLIFKLTQHKRDKELLELIAKYLNCGAVYSHSKMLLFSK
jgi:LAGLIDADG endonuclease